MAYVYSEIFFLSFEMSSKGKDPNEVDLFQQTWQVQEIALCGEKNVAAAKEGAVYPGMHMSMTDFTGEGFFTCSCHLFFSMGRCQASHVILRQASSFMRARLQCRAGGVEVCGEVPPGSICGSPRMR